MSRRIFFALFLIVGLSCVNACKPSGPAPEAPIDLKKTPTTFRATVKSTGSMNRMGVNTGDVVLYRAGDNFRMEPKNSPSSVVILNGEKKMMYYLVPAQKVYLEQPFNDQMKAQADFFKSFINRPDLKIEQLGKETVDGHPCVKLKLTTDLEGKPSTTTLWCATDLRNLPIKIETDVNGQASVVELTDVSFTVDAAVFMPPGDFTKKAVPAE